MSYYARVAACASVEVNDAQVCVPRSCVYELSCTKPEMELDALFPAPTDLGIANRSYNPGGKGWREFKVCAVVSVYSLVVACLRRSSIQLRL